MQGRSRDADVGNRPVGKCRKGRAGCTDIYTLGLPLGSAGKNLPATQKTQARSLGFVLGRDNPLKKETATHSSILAWEIPWIAEPVHGVTESEHV